MLFVLFVCRCVCAASGLCLPAVPEGQADQAGVPDSVLPGSLCSCWSGFPLRHLSDIHRWVHMEGWSTEELSNMISAIPHRLQ